MTFTEEDAEKDGYIKAEAESSLQGVASRESPEIYDYFTAVCDELGVKPGRLLADMAVRSLNNPDFGQTVAGTEISLNKAKMDEVRESDLEFVQKLQDRFGPDEQKDGKIEKLIESRLEREMGSPVPRLNRDGGGQAEANQAIIQQMQSMQQQMQDMQQRLNQQQNGEVHDDFQTSAEREEEIDGLFDGDDNGGQESSVDEEQDLHVEEEDNSSNTRELNVVEPDDEMDDIPLDDDVEEWDEDGEGDVEVLVGGGEDEEPDVMEDTWEEEEEPDVEADEGEWEEEDPDMDEED